MVTRHATRKVIEGISTTRSSNYVCRQCRQHLSSGYAATQTRTFVSTSSRKDSNNEKPLSTLEKIRKSLWKGEAPGPKDIDEVYGGKGAIAEMREERRARRGRKQRLAIAEDDRVMNFGTEETSKAGERLTEQETAASQEELQHIDGSSSLAFEDAHAEKDPRLVHTATMPSYDAENIDNWEGLEVIGHRGQWQEMPVSSADDYKPWIHANKTPGLTYSELIPILENTAKQVLGRKKPILDQKVDLTAKETFKLLRQFSQVTQFRIPDPVLNRFRHNQSMQTYRDLLILLAEEMRPVPANVTEQLAADHKLSSIANLSIASRRESSIDKDKELGRWKLIEQELHNRGLPVHMNERFKYWPSNEKRAMIETSANSTMEDDLLQQEVAA